MIKTRGPPFYSNEPKVCSRKKSHLSGDLDILLGEIVEGTSVVQHIVTINDKEYKLLNTHISETKSEDGHLAAKRLRKKSEPDLNIVSHADPQA